MENEFKSIKISKKSWHYKLMSWFLGEKVPKPSNTFNFCRYFWILMFCIFLVPIFGPFKLLAKILKWVLELIDKKIYDINVNKFNTWSKSLSNTEMFDLYEGGYFSLPKKFRNQDFCTQTALSIWAKKNFGLNWYDLNDRELINEELNKIELELIKVNQERSAIISRNNEIKRIKLEKRELLIKKINKRLSFISIAFGKLGCWITELFNFNYSKMINISKKVFGVVLTGLFLGISFILVNYLTFGFIWIGGVIWDNINYILGVSLVIIALVIVSWIVYLMYSFIYDKIIIMVKKYKSGESIWYIQLLYWIIILPVHYLIYTPIYWVTVGPLNFIFIHFIYNFIFRKILVSFGKWCYNGLISFTGIFGEYFSASKGDYCPGIEWDCED